MIIARPVLDIVANDFTNLLQSLSMMHLWTFETAPLVNTTFGVSEPDPKAYVA